MGHFPVGLLDRLVGTIGTRPPPVPTMLLVRVAYTPAHSSPVDVEFGKYAYLIVMNCVARYG